MPDRTQSILLAGLGFGVLLGIVAQFPVVGGCLACFVVVGAGVFSVWHYTDTHQISVSGGQGALIGLGAAALAAVIEALIQGVLRTIGVIPGMAEQQEEAMEAMGDMMDPQQMEAMQEFVGSPSFLIAMVGCTIVIYGVFGAVGGAIGAAIFTKGEDNNGGGPAPSPDPDPSPIPPRRRDPDWEPSGPESDPNGEPTEPSPERRPTESMRR